MYAIVSGMSPGMGASGAAVTVVEVPAVALERCGVAVVVVTVLEVFAPLEQAASRTATATMIADGTSRRVPWFRRGDAPSTDCFISGVYEGEDVTMM
jgi:hypothetical protein